MVVFTALKETVVNFQNVLQEHLVSTVKIAVSHVSTNCVTDRTDSVHMVALTA